MSGDAVADPAAFASLTGKGDLGLAGSDSTEAQAQAWFKLTGEVVEPDRKAQSIAALEAKLKKCTATVDLPVYWQSADPKKEQRVLGKVPAGTPFGSLSEPTAKRMEMPAPTGKRWVEPSSPPTCAPAGN